MCCTDAGWNISKLYFSLKKKSRIWEKEVKGKTFQADLKQSHIFSITTNPRPHYLCSLTHTFFFQLSNCQPVTKQQQTAPYWHSDCHLRGFHTQQSKNETRTLVQHTDETSLKNSVFPTPPDTAQQRVECKNKHNPSKSCLSTYMIQEVSQPWAPSLCGDFTSPPSSVYRHKWGLPAQPFP